MIPDRQYWEEAPTVVTVRSESRRARKPHVCCGCGGAIPVGEVYGYGFYLIDGEPQQFHQHQRACWEGDPGYDATPTPDRPGAK